MPGTYSFRPLAHEELPAMLGLIHQRIAWMDEVGVRQWNVTDYDGVYPPEYYEACWQRGELFALVETISGDVVCAGCLKTCDDRWPDGHTVPALYLHHLAASLAHKGAGCAFLRSAEEHAARNGMTFLRLDSAIGNPALTRWYESQGYLPAGRCVDGAYEGILRQKRLSQQAQC